VTNDISNTPSSQQLELGIRLESILMPHARKQRTTFYSGEEGLKASAKFVHYTTAEAAFNIIKSKRIWMRNATCMADYREVQHGFEMLRRFFADAARKQRFFEAFDAVSPNIAKEALTLFDQWWANIRLGTYIASISEHDDREDLHGRLSMWRAFGGNTARVAIVLTIPWFSPSVELLNLIFGPVAYLREEEAHAVIEGVIENVRTDREFLLSIDRPVVVGAVFNMLVATVTCLKHAGFHEEREWRAIYAPSRSSSPLMESSVEVIRGIPQVIHQLPLDANVADAFADLDLARIFDRLIIGPTQFPWPIREVFTKALTAIGVNEAENRVFISGIPIRS
jgi:hypothetical protein